MIHAAPCGLTVDQKDRAINVKGILRSRFNKDVGERARLSWLGQLAGRVNEKTNDQEAGEKTGFQTSGHGQTDKDDDFAQVEGFSGRTAKGRI